MAAKTQAERDRDEGILTLARERFKVASSHEDARRTRQLFDYKFSLGKISESESYQWNDNDKSLRKGRPMLTNNRVGPHCRQTVNQIRQARQAVKVNPVDNGADPDKAEVRQGVIRRIESRSNADIAYMIAADQMVRMGEGYVRVFSEYLNPAEGPEQELTVKAIRNRFSVYGDPAAMEFDASDARFTFVTEDLSKDDYEAQYPDSEVVGLSDFTALGDQQATWFPKGHVRIAEYFYVESTYRKVVIPAKTPGGTPTTHTLEDRTVCWVKMNGMEILERQTLPIPWIPVARAVGEVVDLEGEVDFRGVVRDAIDPQKMLNYMESSAAEMIALAPKAPWVMAEGQDEDHPEWDTANQQNYSKLIYKPKTYGGELAPPPQRQSVEPPIQALTLMGVRAENNLRATLGVVDVDAQERQKEQSGRAIVARQRQNELSNSHFAENHALMIRQVGRILNAWMKFIYDTPRTMEIMGADESRKTVMIHAGNAQSAQPASEDIKVYDLNVGRYDIEISVGPSYQTRRQEAVDMMTQVITAKPELLQVMGDLYFGNMDWPEARQIGERFKKLLPQQLQDEKGKPQVPPEVQQQMQQQGQMIEAMTKELNAKNQLIETDQIKMAGQYKIEELKASVTREKSAADNETKLAVAELGAKVDRLALFLEERARLGVQGHDAAMGHADAEHDVRMAQLGHQQALEQGEQATAGTLASQQQAADLAPAAEAGA